MKVSKLIISIVAMVFVANVSFAENVLRFDGQLDLSKNTFDVLLKIDEKSSVTVTVQKQSETDYYFFADIEHLKTPFFDFLSKIESSVKVIPDKNNSKTTLADATLRGTIWSQHALVDYKPVRELSGNFEIIDQRLKLTSLSFGNIKCDGFIDLVEPYRLDLAFNLFNVGMDNFLSFWSNRKDIASSGTVSGKIKASGTISNLALHGSLESSQGYVEKLNYENIALNIEGIYPHMEIAHSTISKSDGVSFTIDGSLNLSDKENFEKQIKALTMAPVVSDSGSELEWTIRRLSPEESDNGVTELKYRFRKGDALGIGTSAEDETDMFGFERTRKF